MIVLDSLPAAVCLRCPARRGGSQKEGTACHFTSPNRDQLGSDGVKDSLLSHSVKESMGADAAHLSRTGQLGYSQS